MANVIRTINLERVLSTPGTSAGVTGRGVLLLEEETIAFGLPSSKPLASPPLPNDNTCSLPICAPLRFVANRVLTAPPPERPASPSGVEDLLGSLWLKSKDILHGIVFLKNNPSGVFNKVEFFLDLSEKTRSVLDELKNIDRGGLSSDLLNDLIYLEAVATSLDVRISLALATNVAYDPANLERIRAVPFFQGIRDHAGLKKLAFDTCEKLLAMEVPKEKSGEIILLTKWITLGYCIEYASSLFYVETRLHKSAEGNTNNFDATMEEIPGIIEWTMDNFYRLAESDARNAARVEVFWPVSGQLLNYLEGLIAQSIFELRGTPERRASLESLEGYCHDMTMEMALGFSFIEPNKARRGEILAFLAGRFSEYKEWSLAIELLEGAEKAFAEAGKFWMCYAATLRHLDLINKFHNSDDKRRLKLRGFLTGEFLENSRIIGENNPALGLLYKNLVYLRLGEWEKALPVIRLAFLELRDQGKYVDEKMVVDEAARGLRRIADRIDKTVVPFRKNGPIKNIPFDMAAEFEAEGRRIAPFAELQEKIENISGELFMGPSENVIPAKKVGQLKEISPLLLELTTMALESGEKGLIRYTVRLWTGVSRYAYSLSGGGTATGLDGEALALMRELHILANSKILEIAKKAGSEFRSVRLDVLRKLFDATDKDEYFTQYFAEARGALPIALGENNRAEIKKLANDSAYMLARILKKGDFAAFTTATMGEIMWMRGQGHRQIDLADKILIELRGHIEALMIALIDSGDDKDVAKILLTSASVFKRLGFYGGTAASLVHASVALAGENKDFAGRVFDKAKTYLEAFAYEVFRSGEQMKADDTKEKVRLAGEWEELVNLTNEILKVKRDAKMELLQVYAMMETVRFSREILAGNFPDDDIPADLRGHLVQVFGEALKGRHLEDMVSRLSGLSECQGLSRAELQDTAVRLVVEYARERSLMGTLSNSAALVDVFSEMDDEWLLTKVRRGKDARPSLIDLFGVEAGWKTAAEKDLPDLEGFKDHVR